MSQASHPIPPASLGKAIGLYLIAALFLVFEMAVQVSPSVMAPELMRDLQLSAFALGLMSGFYFYTYTVMQVPSGLLFDRFKPRLIISLSIFTCAAGCFVFGIATNYYLGCLARLLTGFGSAFAFVSVLVVAADLFNAKYFALLAGITQMLAAFGAMLGQMPVRLLIESLGWRHTMFALSGTGVILMLLVWRWMNYEKYPEQQLCHFSATPNIGKSLHLLLKNRQTWFIAAYACLLWAPMSGFASLWGVSFLVKMDQLSNSDAAFYCSLMWLGLAVTSPLLGALANIIRAKYILVGSAMVGAIAFGSLLTTSLNTVTLSIALLAAGAACAGQALSFAVVRDNNVPALKATAIAFNNMAVVVSGAIVQPLIGHFLNQSPGTTLSQYLLHDYQKGLSVILGAYIVGAIVAAFAIKK